MKFDQFLRRAQTADPVVVLHVAFANGLGHHARPGAARRAGARPGHRSPGHRPALALRRRHGLPRPQGWTKRPSSTFLEDLGRRLPRKAVLFPTHDEYIWPLSRHAERLEPWYHIPFSRWPVMQRLYDKKRADGGGGARRAWTRRARCSWIRTPTWTAAAAEIGFPAIFKPVESLAFKLRFHRHVLEIAVPRRARARLRARHRLRHADAAGGRARRRRGALDVRLLPGRRSRGPWRCTPATSCASTRCASATAAWP